MSLQGPTVTIPAPHSHSYSKYQYTKAPCDHRPRALGTAWPALLVPPPARLRALSVPKARTGWPFLYQGLVTSTDVTVIFLLSHSNVFKCRNKIHRTTKETNKY